MHADKRHIILLLLLAFAPLRAQDIHFSQIDHNPILYNTAYNGFFDGLGRFGLIYRNQWATVHNPFQTLAATAEGTVYQDRYSRSGISVGGFVYADKAGALSYGTFSANLIVSYYKALNSRKDNLLSFAIEGAYNRSGFDPSDAEMTDPSESFESEHVQYPTFGAGIAWFCQMAPLFSTRFGFSAHNINRPKIAYYALDSARLEPRFNLYLRGDYRFNESWSFLPLATAQFQKRYTEILFGTDFKYYVDDNSKRYLAFSAGASYRWADALIFNFAAEYNAYTIFFHYDANISKLTHASKSIGAFEVGLLYRLNRKNNKYKPLPCPII